MEVILASTLGFCAGVRRAVDTIEFVLREYLGRYKIYVLHEIVHNRYIIDDFTKRGVIFVENVDQVENGSVLVFSAHGVPSSIEEEAYRKNVYLIDATCPLVCKVHREAQKYESQDLQIILVGHDSNHPEVVGIKGRVKQKVLFIQNLNDIDYLPVLNTDKLAYVTQTTLSIDDTSDIIKELQKKFPKIRGPKLNDICYATQNRQNAVKKLTKIVDTMLIIGSRNSSNSNRLYHLSKSQGVETFLVDSYKDVNLRWFKNSHKLGISAGASAPDILVTQLIDYLKSNMDIELSTLEGKAEKVQFKLPIMKG